MDREKIKELRSLIGSVILELENVFGHDNDGSYLIVNEQELFGIMSRVIGSQPVRKFRKGLHKALDIIEEDMNIEPRTCEITGKQMTKRDFK